VATSLTHGRALRYAGGSARGLLHHVPGHCRLDSSRTKPGNGLGLSLVSGVMKLHKGALLLEDNNPGLAAKLVLPLHKG
jgi:signal transduction histidine kinase